MGNYTFYLFCKSYLNSIINIPKINYVKKNQIYKEKNNTINLVGYNKVKKLRKIRNLKSHKVGEYSEYKY